MRRLPPRDVKTNLSGLTILCPELTEEFLQRVDQPLETRLDVTTKRRYILCDYNRDGDSFRSPWSNQYDPPIPEEEGGGFYPVAYLRQLEVECNEVFDVYRELYYEAANSASSVYCWELDDGAFASCWLIKKEIGSGKFVSRGCWDGIHVIEAHPNPDGKTCDYKLTTTVLLTLGSEHPETTGSVDLSGSLTRQATGTFPLTADRTHVVNMGTMIESMEGDLRASLDALYISKTKEIAATLHRRQDSGPIMQRSLISDLSAAMKAKTRIS